MCGIKIQCVDTGNCADLKRVVFTPPVGHIEVAISCGRKQLLLNKTHASAFALLEKKRW